MPVRRLWAASNSGDTMTTALDAIIAGLKDRPSRSPGAMMESVFLRTLLPYLFIIELRHGAPFYRLAGSAIRSAAGFDLKGKSFYANWDERARGIVGWHFTVSQKEGLCFYLRAVSAGWPDREGTEFEAIFIPVRRADRTDRFVGVNIPQRNVDAQAPMNLRLQSIAFIESDMAMPPRPFPRLVCLNGHILDWEKEA